MTERDLQEFVNVGNINNEIKKNHDDKKKQGSTSQSNSLKEENSHTNLFNQ